MTSLALSLLLASSALAAPAPGSISAPLLRRTNSISSSASILSQLTGNSKGWTALDEVARLQNKLDTHAQSWARNTGRSVPSDVLRRAEKRQTAPKVTGHGSGSIPITEFYSSFVDISYYANVTVGTPPQSFLVVADSGSSDFWLGAPGSVEFPATFDPKSSSTYQNDGTSVSIPYGKGEFDGTVGIDTVSLAGFSTEDSIVESGVVNDPAFSDHDMTGIMGFAWSQLSASNSLTFMEQLVFADVLSQNVSSFHLARGSDTLKSSDPVNGTVSGGTITLGGVDNSTFTGSLDFYPIVEQAHWVVQSQGIVVNGQVVSGSSNVQTMMDTGTSLIVLPTDVTTALATAIGGQFDQQSGLVFADCASSTLSNGNISVRLNGKDYPIAAEELVSQVVPVNSSEIAKETGIKEGGNLCVLPFTAGDLGSEVGQTQPLAIMGDSFLKSYVSVFDVGNQQVGLAQAVPASQFNSLADAINFKLKQQGLSASSTGSKSSGVSRASATSGVLVGAAVVLVSAFVGIW